MQDALLSFVPFGGFHGRVISNQNGHALIEETLPKGARLLPYYIMHLKHYTEREARNICREIARRIQLFHNSNVVHRKLHMENVIVESEVRFVLEGKVASCLVCCFANTHLNFAMLLRTIPTMNRSGMPTLMSVFEVSNTPK